MFSFFKKGIELLAPVSGNAVDLSQVPDPVFSQKMAGDGLAIEATGDTAVAPCDGTITLIFKTNHAFGMQLDNGIELLIHIGIDTVELNGEGFERLIEEGSKVKAGTPIIKFDKEFIKNKGLSLSTPVLVTNVDVVKEIKPSIGTQVSAGKDIVLTIKK